MSLLECIDVSRRFGGLVALADINFSVHEGEVVGLIGPNGAGKTTLFNLIAGLYQPTSGKIKFRGEVTSNLSPDRICKKGIGRTFQIPQPFKGLTVLENLKIGSYFGGRKNIQIKDNSELITFFGLNTRMEESIENLTIAEQKRVEVARALATHPYLLLLDEVAAGLTPAEQDEFANLVRRIRDELQVTIIMVEHIMHTVMGISDRIIVLEGGRILRIGDPQTVCADKDVIRAYLGEEYAELAYR